MVISSCEFISVGYYLALQILTLRLKKIFSTFVWQSNGIVSSVKVLCFLYLDREYEIHPNTQSL